jgi:pimeloyl-ACP methyl ester carboxylesterase
MAVLCLVLASTPVLAAESLISSHLGQPRTFTVHTPDSYASQTARYPVLYVLDGESSHGYSVAVADFLAENALVPEMIVVAVDAGETRMTDFMPAGDPSKGAAAFLGFLTEELVPYIDGHYRTAPVRILAGHSLGGLFVTHAFAAKPGAFRGYVAMSPYLTKEIGTPLLDRVGAALKPGMPAGVFYAVLGAEPDLEPVFTKLESLLATAPAQFASTIERDAGKTHMTTRMNGLYSGLGACFAGWSLSEAELTKGGYARFAAHADSLTARYGYPVLRNEQTFRTAAQQFMGKGDPASANQVAVDYIGQYGNSPFAHFLGAVTAAQLGQREKALASLSKAIELDQKKPTPEIAQLRPHMTQLQTALGGK